MQCRPHCGACCIAPSITTPMPNMPQGKAANTPCANLDLDTLYCRIWESADYPKHCRDFVPVEDVCGQNREEALALIQWFEANTQP